MNGHARTHSLIRTGPCEPWCKRARRTRVDDGHLHNFGVNDQRSDIVRTPPYAPAALAGGDVIVTNDPSLGCTRELIVPGLDGNVVHPVQVVVPMTPESTKSFSPPLE